MSLAFVAQVLISLGSLASVLMAGRRKPDRTPRFPYAPWVLLFTAHGLFLTYALLSGQPFFLLLNVGMMTAAVLNFRAARLADRKQVPA